MSVSTPSSRTPSREYLYWWQPTFSFSSTEHQRSAEMDLNLKFKTEAFEFCIWECGPKSSVLLRKMGEEKKGEKTGRILSHRQFRYCLYKATKKEVNYFTLSILAFRCISSAVLLILMDVKVVTWKQRCGYLVHGGSILCEVFVIETETTETKREGTQKNRSDVFHAALPGNEVGGYSWLKFIVSEGWFPI